MFRAKTCAGTLPRCRTFRRPDRIVPVLDEGSSKTSKTVLMAASAEAADLTYVSDAEPGLRRRRAGARFRYLDLKGRPIGEGGVLERIRALVIPPAWTDVWISPDPDGHIQATGRDARGRKQYRYHARWASCRDEVKYEGLAAFARSLPALRRRVEADLARHGLPRERVLAIVAWLLDHTLIRVGNAAYAKENKSFGLTTLRDRHVEVSGATARFSFRGKTGKEWSLKVSDRRIASLVRKVQDLPGQHLFQYLDEDGQRRAVASQDVNAYLRAAGGPDISSKHFRTWAGTVRAARLLAEIPVPETKAGQKRALTGVIDTVAGRLGNTRAVCRRCYVHPLVIDAWTEGRLEPELAQIRRRVRRAPRGLDREEAVLVRWLEMQRRS
jgi:DNA topoisomerase-1